MQSTLNPLIHMVRGEGDSPVKSTWYVVLPSINIQGTMHKYKHDTLLNNLTSGKIRSGKDNSTTYM
jgi:hypothetical protein